MRDSHAEGMCEKKQFNRKQTTATRAHLLTISPADEALERGGFVPQTRLLHEHTIAFPWGEEMTVYPVFPSLSLFEHDPGYNSNRSISPCPLPSTDSSGANSTRDREGLGSIGGLPSHLTIDHASLRDEPLFHRPLSSSVTTDTWALFTLSKFLTKEVRAFLYCPFPVWPLSGHHFSSSLLAFILAWR